MLGIDFGHGCKFDTGAVSTLITEEEVINTVGALVVQKLKSLNYSVLELRPATANSVSDSLFLRYNKANENKVERCISIHANAGGGTGTEVFTYNAQDKGGAGNVLKELVALGFTNRGIKSGNGLAMVKRPSMTAMLIEVCFIDNVYDVNLYKALGADKIASAIVKGLTGQYVISNNVANNTTTETGYHVGWNQEPDGRWWYAVTKWTYCKSEWRLIDNNWYYFDDLGYTVTNSWRLIDNNWYFFDNDGKLQTAKWTKSNNNKWYYLSANGAMLTSTFLSKNNKVYYIGIDGIMKENTTFIVDNKEYTADTNGVILQYVEE